ncbi:MAG: hypothetical protein ACTSU5_02825 [Promethearchaeota archaeon]
MDKLTRIGKDASGPPEEARVQGIVGSNDDGGSPGIRRAKETLVFPYGGNEAWIELSLREFPGLDWIVVLTSSAEIPWDLQGGEPAHPREASAQAGGGRPRSFRERAEVYAREFREREGRLPPDRRRELSLVEVPDLRTTTELTPFFLALFRELVERGARVYLNLSSGLMAWRLALYQCAEEFRDDVEAVFLFDKQRERRHDLWLYRPLSKMERRVLSIVAGATGGDDRDRGSGAGGKLSISELRDEYERRHGKKSLSYVLKVASALARDGFLRASKEGRVKYVELGARGQALRRAASYSASISAQLGTPAG